MQCIYCSRELQREAVFCCFCGKKQIKKAKSTKRANGEGGVWKRKNGTWCVETVLWYYWDDATETNKARRVSKSGFPKKVDADNYLPLLREAGYRKWGAQARRRR